MVCQVLVSVIFVLWNRAKDTTLTKNQYAWNLRRKATHCRGHLCALLVLPPGWIGIQCDICDIFLTKAFALLVDLPPETPKAQIYSKCSRSLVKEYRCRQRHAEIQLLMMIMVMRMRMRMRMRMMMMMMMMMMMTMMLLLLLLLLLMTLMFHEYCRHFKLRLELLKHLPAVLFSTFVPMQE